ncbi:MAG: hypothetical protein FE78DRAFT_74156 [Acidomyces sp. 'richmondensis']|nr:MAG: hypothetical protein FE78DRAFT_74156 [Acidomyces sp. 'richmondensis']
MAEPDEWTCLGEYESLAEAVYHCYIQHPVKLTDPTNPYGGAYVSLAELNQSLGLPLADTSCPVIDKYDRLDETAKAKLTVYDLACEQVLAADVVQDALRRSRT